MCHSNAHKRRHAERSDGSSRTMHRIVTDVTMLAIYDDALTRDQ